MWHRSPHRADSRNSHPIPPNLAHGSASQKTLKNFPTMTERSSIVVNRAIRAKTVIHWILEARQGLDAPKTWKDDKLCSFSNISFTGRIGDSRPSKSKQKCKGSDKCLKDRQVNLYWKRHIQSRIAKFISVFADTSTAQQILRRTTFVKRGKIRRRPLCQMHSPAAGNPVSLTLDGNVESF